MIMVAENHWSNCTIFFTNSSSKLNLLRDRSNSTAHTIGFVTRGHRVSLKLRTKVIGNYPSQKGLDQVVMHHTEIRKYVFP